MRTHKKTRKNYRCPLQGCKRTFLYLRSLKKHVRYYHPEFDIGEEEEKQII